jgi:hypothetical protein
MTKQTSDSIGFVIVIDNQSASMRAWYLMRLASTDCTAALLMVVDFVVRFQAQAVGPAEMLGMSFISVNAVTNCLDLSWLTSPAFDALTYFRHTSHVSSLLSFPFPSADTARTRAVQPDDT